MKISTSAQNWTPEELFDFVKAQYAPVVEYKGVTNSAEEQFRNWYKNLIITGSDEDSEVYNKLLNDFLPFKIGK